MGIFQNLLKGMGENKKELKEKFKEAEQNMKIQKMLEEREKSSNQRELERYMKEQREKAIKVQVERIRKIQTKEAWKGTPIFKGQRSILTEDKKILSSDRPIFTKKNIFLTNKIKIPLMGKGMFLKW